MASEIAPAKSSRHVIVAAADFPPGGRKIVKIAGREIGVFNVNGHFYALRNVCPHRRAPLCRGRLRPLVISPGVGQVAHEREGEILKCPWHMWEFDVKTGRALHDEAVGVRTYRVVQEGEKVVLYLDRPEKKIT